MTDEQRDTEQKLNNLIRMATVMETNRCVKVVERKAIELMRKGDANSKLLFALANEIRHPADPAEGRG